MINESDKKEKQLIKENKENEIIEQILEWIIDNPFVFVLVLVGASYLIYRISKALFYPVQTLNGIVHLVNRFGKNQIRQIDEYNSRKLSKLGA